MESAYSGAPGGACKINTSSHFQAFFQASISLPPSHSRMYEEAAQSTKFPAVGMFTSALATLPFQFAGFPARPRHLARKAVQLRSSNQLMPEPVRSCRTRQFVV